jgi:hypothetical protein
MKKKMRSLQEYKLEIDRIKSSPGALANLNVEMSADYAFYSEMFGELELERASFFNTVKFADDKPLSDSACEAKWLLEENGKKWMMTKRYLRGLEKMQSAIKNLTYVANQEAHNQY